MAKQAKRWEAFYNLLKDKDHRIGAEIGSFKGETTKYILDWLNIEFLYCIDPWLRYEDFEKVIYNKKTKQMDFEKDVYQVFLKNMEGHEDRIKILRMFSKEAAQYVEDEFLDFIFIDGNHAYEYVKDDIQLWEPKVKRGGLISGHDYGNKKFGVTEAVDEILANEQGYNINVTPNQTIWWVIKR